MWRQERTREFIEQSANKSIEILFPAGGFGRGRTHWKENGSPVRSTERKPMAMRYTRTDGTC